MSLDSYISYLETISDGLEDMVLKSVIKNKNKILAIIRNRLFQTGTDGNGNKLSPSYSDYTIFKKRNKTPRQRTSHVTLRDTGNFYKSMVVQVIGKEVFVDAKSYVTPLLKEKYGEAILSLNGNELDFIIDSFIEPEVNKYINSFNGNIEIDL